MSGLVEKAANIGAKAVEKIKKLIQELKNLKIKAIVLLIILAIGSLVLALTHVIFVFSKASGDVGAGCPYVPESLGLTEPQAQTPILFNISNIIIEILYSPSKTGNSTGIISKYRNALLDSTAFQVSRIFIFVLVLSLIGASFAFGFTQLKAKDILKRIIILVIFLWFTDNSNYQLYDELIDPLATTWYRQIANVVNGAVAKAVLNSGEISRYVEKGVATNEFVLLDALVSSMFSRAIFDKLASLIFVNTEPTPTTIAFRQLLSGAEFLPDALEFIKASIGVNLSFFITLAITILFYMVCIYLVLKFIAFVIEVTFFKIVIVIGLSVFPIFTLFIATMALNKSMDKFSKFFSTFVNVMLVKPGISIILLTLAGSIVVSLILEQFGGAFSFYACVQRVWTGLLSIFGKYYYFIAYKPTKDEIFGSLILERFFNEILSANWNFLALPIPDAMTILLFMLIPNFLMIAFLVKTFDETLKYTKEYVSHLADGLGGGIGGEIGQLWDKASGAVLGLANKGFDYLEDKDKKNKEEEKEKRESNMSKTEQPSPTSNPDPNAQKPLSTKTKTPTGKNKKSDTKSGDEEEKDPDLNSETEEQNPITDEENNKPKPIVSRPNLKKSAQSESELETESQVADSNEEEQTSSESNQRPQNFKRTTPSGVSSIGGIRNTNVAIANSNVDLGATQSAVQVAEITSDVVSGTTQDTFSAREIKIESPIGSIGEDTPDFVREDAEIDYSESDMDMDMDVDYDIDDNSNTVNTISIPDKPVQINTISISDNPIPVNTDNPAQINTISTPDATNISKSEVSNKTLPLQSDNVRIKHSPETPNIQTTEDVNKMPTLEDASKNIEESKGNLEKEMDKLKEISEKEQKIRDLKEKYDNFVKEQKGNKNN